MASIYHVDVIIFFLNTHLRNDQNLFYYYIVKTVTKSISIILKFGIVNK